jgi:Mrp family chromosome partitioning ATPase
MPTNVSVPIWRCDFCGATFRQNEAAAQRCEAAGQPVILPPGSLMLDYHDARHLNGNWEGGFQMHQLYPFPGRFGTVASEYNQAAGHTVSYAVDVDPEQCRDERGIYRFPGGRQPREVRTEHLDPYEPGALTVAPNTWLGHYRGLQPTDDYGWILDAVGLPRSAMNPNRDVADWWVRPLTPEVRAVLDAIGAWPKLIENRPDRRRYRDEWLVNNKLGGYALGVTREEGRPASKQRAVWYLRGADQDRLVGEVNDLWRRWRGGASVGARCEPEAVHAPQPRLVSMREHLTASKLSKELKALVAATGVEWPARTDATTYANLLIDKTVEYRMETDDRLFAAAIVIAVKGRKGGVGKSTVAAALARRLARAGHSVVLVDFDVAGPSQHLIHDLGPVATDTERVMVLPSETDVPGLRVFSPGQIFGPAAKNQWSETTVQQWVDFVGSSLDLGGADFVVLDMPPGESALHSAVSNSHTSRIDAEVHVTTGHPLALADAERDLCNGRGRARYRYLVENLSRIRGNIGLGHEVEMRLHGVTDEAVRALATRSQTEWGGSLPWVSGVDELASTPEMDDLAVMIAATPVPS